jgi:hypothetical protein
MNKARIRAVANNPIGKVRQSEGKVAEGTARQEKRRDPPLVGPA